MYNVQKRLVISHEAFIRALGRIFPGGYDIQLFSRGIAIEMGEAEADRQATEFTIMSMSPSPTVASTSSSHDPLALQEYLQWEGVILS